MDSDRLSPAIGLLQAISPDPDRPDKDTLTYPRLARAIKTNRSLEEVLLNTLDTAEDESASHLAAAIKLAEYELIETASALQSAQTPARQQELSRQFTNASINIFGQPDRVVASYLLEQLLTELCVLQTNYNVDGPMLDKLIQTYSDILARGKTPQEYVLPFDAPAADEAAAMLGRFLHDEYDASLQIFEGDRDQWIDALGIVRLFERALESLQHVDNRWADWKVLVTDDTCLSVNPDINRIVVGSNRHSLRLGTLKGLFGHEILVHAQRALNGQRLGEAFEYGLPGYINAEEGLGCFVEQALSGGAPLKMYDRYLDVALALGTFDGQPRTRRELFDIAFARTAVRSQAFGRTASPHHIERETWTHVNRIFRGTLGNDVVGVFTKDIAYYDGYQKIAGFAVEECSSGTPIDELWALLVLGKFDPTNTRHMIELMKLGY